MKLKNVDVELRADTLSPSNLKRLKWSVIVAVAGFPILVQTLGAMMLFHPKYPILSSTPAIILFGLLAVVVFAAGIYALTRRIFLRFSGMNNGLREWEAKTQKDAFAFSYRVIKVGMLMLFAGVSIFGAAQLLDVLGAVNLGLNSPIQMDLSAFAAFTIVLTYVVLFLPALYMAWTIKPLIDD